MTPLIRRYLVVILLAFSFFGMRAQDEDADDESTGTVILVPEKNKGHRLPSSVFIECHYAPGHISFVMPSEILFMEVSISKDEVVLWKDAVTRQHPEANIPVLPSGEYTIVCRTDGNQVFQGVLTY